MKSPLLIFDIETRPYSVERVRELELLPRLKLGNTKDPEKIKEKEAAHEADAMEKAALDPTISEVCAVGWHRPGLTWVTTVDPVSLTERDLIEGIFAEINLTINAMGRICGFNIIGFDLPYLIRRAMILGIPWPTHLRHNNRWDQQHIVDLMEVWQLGDRQSSISLDRLAKALGVGKKSGNGKDFHKLLATDPQAAVAYLENDLKLTAQCAEKLGVK